MPKGNVLMMRLTANY